MFFFRFKFISPDKIQEHVTVPNLCETYGNYIKATMGNIGERTHRSVWRKLGTTPRGQGFTPKIEFFNEIPFVVLGAAWDFSILPQ